MKILAELSHKNIPRMISIHHREFYGIDQSPLKKLIIERGSANEKTLSNSFGLHRFQEQLNTTITLDIVDGLAGNDNISPVRERPMLLRKRKVRIASHDHNSPLRKSLESLEIFRNIPWESVFTSDKK